MFLNQEVDRSDVREELARDRAERIPSELLKDLQPKPEISPESTVDEADFTAAAKVIQCGLGIRRGCDESRLSVRFRTNYINVLFGCSEAKFMVVVVGEHGQYLHGSASRRLLQLLWPRRPQTAWLAILS